MDKLKLHTPDLTAQNIEKLAALFPNCVTETLDHQKNPKRAIDFDLLRQELSDHIVDGPRERYHLDWPGKREALLAANAPIAKTLRPCREESVDFDSTQNLFIEGDNLDALKLLQETYLGKVKMIYIDPPYNTGKDFIYEDDFKESTSDFFQRSNQNDDSGQRLVANTESNGRFHSDWLSMMYPRLKLARNLLKEDGFLFISIDDHEIQNLRKLCDEVFGEENFISIIAVENNPKGRKNSKYVSVSSEFLLIYARNKNDDSSFFIENIPKDPNSIQVDKNGKKYTPGKRVLVGKSTNPKVSSISSKKHYSVYYNSLTNKLNIEKETTLDSESDKLLTEGFKRYISERDGNFIENTYTAEEFKKLHDEELLIYKEDTIYEKDSNYFTRIKSLLVNDKTKRLDLKTETAKKLIDPELRECFDNPKNVRFLQILLTLVPDHDSKVLDFFSGSATTAHAVMQLNAEDGGKRQHIMVQLPEVCDKRSEAYKAGYKTIAEIGKERIRRAGQKIFKEWEEKQAASAPQEGELDLTTPDSNKSPASRPDIGFRVLKIDSSNMKDVYYTPDAVAQDQLEMLADNIKQDRNDEDLLFQVLVDWGIDLSLAIRKESIAGKTLFYVDENALAACFAPDISAELLTHIAQRHPLRAVFRDHCFPSDSARINAEQIFKHHSPETELRCI